MIEVEKMLHLSRYVTFLRISTKSRVAHLHLRSSCDATNFPTCRGYAYRYAHNGMVQKIYLRTENYAGTCVKTFSTTFPQSSVNDIDHKVTLLCDDIKNGRVSMDSLKEVIRLCNASEYQLHHSTGILLLKCCGSQLPDLDTTERQRLADQVWQLAKRNSKELTVEYYNALLGVYADNSRSVNPKEFLASMSVEPNVDTYCLLLNIATKVGNIKYSQDIMSLIKKKDIAIDEDAFNALIQMYTTSCNITDIEHVITLMQNRKLSTNKAYTELACVYAKLGDIANLVKILNDEPQSDVNLLKIMKVLSISKNSRHILVVLKFMTASVSDFEFSEIITELIRADQIVDAHMIINCLAAKDNTKDVAKNLANSFLNELVILNLPIDDVIKYASDYMDSGIEPSALINLAEIGLKLSRESLCLATFQMMKDKGIEVRPHYYWPLLVTAHHNEGEAKIFSLVKSMIDTDVEMDYDTLVNYVFPYVNTVNPNTTLQKILLSGVPSTIAYTPLISFLLVQNRLQDVITCDSSVSYKIRSKDLIKPLTHAYIATRNAEKCASILTMFPNGRDFVGLFLKSLLSDKYTNFDVNDLQYLLKEFNKHQVKISQQEAMNLKDRLMVRKFTATRNVLELINNMVDHSLKEPAVYHPRYMNTKELNCTLVELKNKGLNTKVILRLLLDAYCHENNFKKCEEIKQEFDACKYEWTPGLKMNMFEIYIKTKKLKEAEALLHEVQNMTDFQLDRLKIVMFACALVEAGEIKKAFDVIQNTTKLNARMDVRKYCRLLLEALARSQDHAYTEDMLNLLLQNKYCNVSMEMLRPLVRIPLERNDISAAVNIFAKCVHKYSKAPLALELLVTLLQQRDKPTLVLSNVNKYIENVYDITSSLHGDSVANTQLAIALAILNKTHELQNILQNQLLSTEMLQAYYTYVQRSDNINGLMTLFRMIPDKTNLDKIAISEMLLSFYNKKGDSDSMLELWKTMCAKNVKPSKQFERMFIQHCLLNKIPLPPEFEQERSEINVSS